MALLYSFVAVAPVLGSSKLSTACERPGPKAKAGAGGAGPAGGGSGAGRTGGSQLLQVVQEALEREGPADLGSYYLAVEVLGVHEHVELV